ncbi:MAG: hypothetical protein CMQ41_01830 [Gammaproteobacteria bacterium]|nr:hypothetical protein [Gammaproteobacteria bacterium]
MSLSKSLMAMSIYIGMIILTNSNSTLAQSIDKPELSGIWSNASRTSLTRPRGVELIVSEEEAREIVANSAIAGISRENIEAGPAIDPETGAPPAGARDFGLRGYNLFWTDPGSNLAQVRGEYRTSYIIDPPEGMIPRLDEPTYDLNRPQFGARYLTGIADASGPEAIPIAERCLIGFGNTAGPGMMGTLYNSSYQFIQTDEYFMIMIEMVHDTRIIPLFDTPEEARASHRPSELQQWLGDSVGWYEGGTLVVETININPLQMGQSSVPISPHGKIIERFSRYSENEIIYQFTVDDDRLYSQPWTAELSYYPLEGRIYEYACHEGNYSMPGILAGARRAEKEQASN